MIWFNINKLELRLSKNNLSEHAAYQYLLLNLILIALVMRVPEPFEFSSDLLMLLDFSLDLFITIGGVYLLYSINSKGDNHDFLKRYFSLAFVQGLRLGFLYVLLRLVYKIVMYVIPEDLWYMINDFAKSDSAEIMLNLCFSIIFYFLLRTSFKRINVAGSRLQAQTQTHH